MANWTELLEELIGKVVKRVVTHHDLLDYFSFRGVCSVWRNAASEKHFNAEARAHKVPWLMLVENEESDERSFYSLLAKRFMNVHLPEAKGRRCWGSPHGWLITIGADLEMHLLNPLTHVRIRLPPQTAFEDQWVGNEQLTIEDVRAIFVKKVILLSSSSPSTNNEDFITVAIYSGGCKVAFAKYGDCTWTTFKGQVHHPEFWDIVGFKDGVYAVDGSGDLKICDFTSIQPKISDFAASPYDEVEMTDVDSVYLVEISGDLHLVLRYKIFYTEIVETEHFKIEFQIFKLELFARKWEKLDGLGNHVIFVGTNHSFSLCVSDTEYSQLKRNSVYFTDDKWEMWDHKDDHGMVEGGRDMGIYSFEDETVEFLDLGIGMYSDFSPPVWITPNMCSIKESLKPM